MSREPDASQRAIETAALMLGSDRSRGYCLEMICADFLAQQQAFLGDVGGGLHEPDASRPSRLATGCVVVREAAAAGAASRWLEVSIVRCDVKLGGSPQPVSQPLRPRFRRQPNHALRPVPCRHPSLKNTNSASTPRHSRRCPRDCAGRSIPETRSVFAGSSTASQIKTAFGRATESGTIFARAFDNTKLSITRASMPEQK